MEKLMNTNIKLIIAIGSAVAPLLSISGASASVLTAPTPGLNLVFDTDGSTQSTPVASTNVSTSIGGLGVGYDPTNTYSQASASTTAQTAQSVYSPLITDSSAAGDFTTISAGSTFQLALHADGLNSANNNLPVTLYASLFNYNASVGTGNIPIGSAVFQNVSIDVYHTPDNRNTDSTFFSSAFTLANSINAGTEYVLAVDGGPAGGSSPTNFGTVDRIGFGPSALPSTDGAIYKQYYLIDNNSGDTGGAYNTYSHSSFNTQPLAYRFYASPASAAPEPSAIAGVAFFVIGLAGLLAVARKRNLGQTAVSD